MWVDNPRYCELPANEQRAEVAHAIGRQLVKGYYEDGLPGITSQLGWRFRVDSLTRPGARKSTIRSLLVPLMHGNFSVVINDEYKPSAGEQLWLIGHEIGHSLFYVPGTPPKRIISHSVEEEQFCDYFADDFIQEFPVL